MGAGQRWRWWEDAASVPWSFVHLYLYCGRQTVTRFKTQAERLKYIYIYIFFWIYIYNIYIYLYTIQGYKAAKVDSDKLMMRDNKFMGYYTQLRPSNSSGESCRCGSHHARPVRVEPQSYPITRGPTASPLRSLANIAKLANIAINIPTICRCTLPKTNIKKEYK